MLNPNSVLYRGRPEAETVVPLLLPLPPVAFFSRDSDPPVLATFITDMARRPPRKVGESGAETPSLFPLDNEEGLSLRWKQKVDSIF